MMLLEYQLHGDTASLEYTTTLYNYLK